MRKSLKLVFIGFFRRHRFIGRAFREKCIFTDYIMKEFLFSIWVISYLKLSLDIFIISVTQFVEFRFIIVKRSCSRPRRQAHPLFSSLFDKSTTFCWYCECTQIKVDPLQLRMMYYSYLYEQKLRRILSCFHNQEKMQSVLQLPRFTQTIRDAPSAHLYWLIIYIVIRLNWFISIEFIILVVMIWEG